MLQTKFCDQLLRLFHPLGSDPLHVTFEDDDIYLFIIEELSFIFSSETSLPLYWYLLMTGKRQKRL